MSERDSLGISEVLNKIKKEFELVEQSEGENDKYGLDVKEIELELFVTAKKENGNVELSVVQPNGELEYEEEEVQKIKVELEPVQIGSSPKNPKRSTSKIIKRQRGQRRKS